MAKTRYHGGFQFKFKNVPRPAVRAAPKPPQAPVPVAAVPFPPGLVVFSSGKERCGINEYSLGLDRQVRLAGVPVTEVLLHDTALLASAPAGAEVLVHLEPSLLSSGFDAALRTAYLRGAKIVGCFHYCNPNFFARFAESTDILVTHRDYGIRHPKLRIIPLACPVYAPPADLKTLRKKHGLPEKAVLITTLGFLTAWKKIPDLIQQMMPELERRGATLQALCPTHFSGDTTGEGQKMQRLVAGRSSVIWKSEFLPEQEMLERVACSDLGLAYHGENTGSCSAANKMFVAGRVPLLLTSSTHDSDHLGAEHVRSFDLVGYARRAVELAHEPATLGALRVRARGDYERMNQAVVAQRYLELFREIKK